MSRLDPLSIHADVPLFDQPLQGGSGRSRIARGQKLVQPLSREGAFHDESLGAFRHRPLRAQVLLSLRAPWAPFCHESRKSKATPMQIALSATLKAGKPAAWPSRRMT